MNDYLTMSPSQLREEFDKWTDRVAEAAGWASAYFAAQQLEQVCRVAHKRGLPWKNPYPIVYGDKE